MAAAVIDALRRFLPRFLDSAPPLSGAQRRALWAITHCRTPVMGGHLYACTRCATRAFAYHSCNHRACPQCGRADTARWVERQLEKRVGAPYFMVTFTLPAELRELFFGRHARDAFDLFFRACSQALAALLASPRGLGAQTSGFTGVLHTWNQRLGFHPHIHYIVPGAGIDAQGRVVRVKNANFLVREIALCKAFRWHFRRALEALDWQVDPAVWTKEWGVRIKPFGDGANAIKYLGAYVCRTAIADSRLLAVDEHSVSFRYKDRAHGDRQEIETLDGLEFVRRYLRHVLPRGLRSIRYYGFCHPAAKKNRQRIAFHTGRPLRIGPPAFTLGSQPAPEPARAPRCPCCHKPMRPLASFAAVRERAPPPAAIP